MISEYIRILEGVITAKYYLYIGSSINISSVFLLLLKGICELLDILGIYENQLLYFHKVDSVKYWIPNELI